MTSDTSSSSSSSSASASASASAPFSCHAPKYFLAFLALQLSAGSAIEQCHCNPYVNPRTNQFIGDTSLLSNVEVACNFNVDDFQSINFNPDFSDPYIGWRLCAKPLTIDKDRYPGGINDPNIGNDYSLRSYMTVANDTSTCTDWQGRQIPDKIASRVFYVHYGIPTDNDNAFLRLTAIQCPEALGKYESEQLDCNSRVPANVALFYADRGTICFQPAKYGIGSCDYSHIKCYSVEDADSELSMHKFELYDSWEEISEQEAYVEFYVADKKPDEQPSSSTLSPSKNPTGSPNESTNNMLSEVSVEPSMTPAPSIPTCDKSVDTGYVDTSGSYGVMFDVSSAVLLYDSDGDENETDFLETSIEIYGIDLYIRNLVNASFEIYALKDPDRDGKYTSYLDASGQTFIEQNWDLIAKGTVPGRGADVGSPIPNQFWRKNIVLEPGETVGLYVAATDGPHLRYRTSTFTEGAIYSTDGILYVGVGRSWGAYPLRGDGSDVWYAPREFSGGFHYRVHEELCSAPRGNAYEGTEAAKDRCPEKSTLETTFGGGTGSHGALFDLFAESDLTLTGIDLNMHWLNGYSSDILIYARRGSWFGHQDKANSWPHLLVNTTIRRPRGLDWSVGEQNMAIQAKRNSAIVPKEAFKPLGIRKGETWGMYVCSSLDDIRYTHGSSNGQTFASTTELRIMEGAGAADYPPFFQGAEYTFHAPRVFNGILRYDHVAECPSNAPSQYGLGISEVPSTVAATQNPTQAPSSNFYEAAAAASNPTQAPLTSAYRTTTPTPIPIATTSVSPSEAPTIVKRQRVRSSSPSTTPNRLPKSDPYPLEDTNGEDTNGMILIDDESPCSNHDECASGICARSEFSESAVYICCTDGDYERIDYSIIGLVCKGRATGTACGGENEVCLSGACGFDNVCIEEKIKDEATCSNNGQCDSGLCARSEVSETSENVCCTGARDYKYINYAIRYVCKGRAPGTVCGGENEVCLSGACGLDNVCIEEKIKDEATCSNNGQCDSGLCALSEASESAENVCCTGGNHVSTNDTGHVCSQRPSMAACAGHDAVCRSGSCGSDGMCAKQLTGYTCSGRDDDCANNACGQVEGVQDAEFVCCPSGEKVIGGSYSLSVCTGIGQEGYFCFTDSICESGICIAGNCKNGKQEEENEPCENDAHCASGSCVNIDSSGLGSCGALSLEAKNEYFNNKSVCPLDTLVPPNVSDKSAVTLHFYGDSSTASYTGSMNSMITEPKRDQSATDNIIVGQELMNGITGCSGGSSVVVQRQGGQVCFSYQTEKDDGDGNPSFTCSKECIEIGSSGSFITYDKSDTNNGISVQAYYFSETRTCRVEVAPVTSTNIGILSSTPSTTVATTSFGVEPEGIATDDGNSDATGFPTLSPTNDDYISVAKNSPPESPEKQPNETPTFSFSGNKSTSEASVISNVVPIVVLAAGAVLLSKLDG